MHTSFSKEIWRFYRDLKTYRQHPTPQRKAVCNRAGWRCEWIDERGQRCAKAAPRHRMFADHKKERRDAPDAELDPTNGWCLCGAHHSLKTAHEREKRLLKG